MITLEDILEGMKNEEEENVFYYDCLNEIGYHLHIGYLGKPTYMKKQNGVITKISEKEFREGIRDTYGNNISENNYYDL